jgi:protoheme IX farnesyltransferase
MRAVALGLVQLTKPGVTRMVLVTVVFGAIIAPGPLDAAKLVVTIVATWAVVAASNTLNMYLERDVDGRMPRTKDRPIPSGRVAPETALWFGVVLAFAGLAVLSFAVNPLSGLLCAVALVSYVLVYTPLKRKTPFSLHVGTLPGAIPPLIGWAAMTGGLSKGAWSLFAIQTVWQIPHFLAISIFRRKEYEGAGFAVYPSIQGVIAAKRAIIGYSVLLLLASLTPLGCGLGGPAYLVVALLLGFAQIVVAIRGQRVMDLERWARRLFFSTLPYLVAVFGCLALTSR